MTNNAGFARTRLSSVHFRCNVVEYQGECKASFKNRQKTDAPVLKPQIAALCYNRKLVITVEEESSYARFLQGIAKNVIFPPVPSYQIHFEDVWMQYWIFQNTLSKYIE